LKAVAVRKFAVNVDLSLAGFVVRFLAHTFLYQPFQFFHSGRLIPVLQRLSRPRSKLFHLMTCHVISEPAFGILTLFEKQEKFAGGSRSMALLPKASDSTHTCRNRDHLRLFH
jgi:hypothetical protein